MVEEVLAIRVRAKDKKKWKKMLRKMKDKYGEKNYLAADLFSTAIKLLEEYVDVKSDKLRIG